MNLKDPRNIFPVPNHVDGRLASISDGFHPIGDMKYRGGKGHLGCDVMYRKKAASAPRHPWSSKWYEMAERTPAVSLAAGRVIFAAKITTGYLVRIDHGASIVTGYFHLSQLLTTVGVTVAPGQPIGIIGGSPIGYGLVHLHFDLQIGSVMPSRRHKVDPAPYLKPYRHLTFEEGWGDFGRAVSESEDLA